MDANIEELKGKTIIRIDGMKENSDEIDFYTSDGSHEKNAISKWLISSR